MRKVEGWASHDSAELIVLLDSVQKALQLSGSVGEVGVHHGRLFILLALLRSPGENALAVDVFGQQELNADRSGRGDRAKFEAAMVRNGIQPESVCIVSASSLTLDPRALRFQLGSMRLLSIDGGHTVDVTVNDLRLAEQMLHDDGVVILDDVFTSFFPGVMWGLTRYLDEAPKLAPFAISSQKLFLAQPEIGAFYRQRLADASPLFMHEEVFFSNQVALFGDSPRLNTQIRLRVSQTAWYQAIKNHYVVRKMRPVLLAALRCR